MKKLIDGQLVDLTTEELANRSPSMQNSVTAKKLLISRASKARFIKETQGIIVDGISINTSRESQAQITSAHLLAQANPSITLQWKVGIGQFVSLNATQINDISTAVANWVQSAFAMEATVVAQINAGTITSIDQIASAFGISLNASF